MRPSSETGGPLQNVETAYQDLGHGWAREALEIWGTADGRWKEETTRNSWDLIEILIGI